MTRFVISQDETDAESSLVGGKAMHLLELSRMGGITVPRWFCVTTDAFDRAMRAVSGVDDLIRELASVQPGDREHIAARSARIRQAIEAAEVPAEIASAVADAVRAFSADASTTERDLPTFAVRSSATAEDMPTASFAGQHDSYLNVAGHDVADAIKRCWASLFTERAVTYRLTNRHELELVRMAVVVQQMVSAESSGVLFTADPVSSNRRVSVVEAVIGLGEALVAGTADADSYRVRDGAVTDRTIAAKKSALVIEPGGGTRTEPVDEDRRRVPVLTDDQVETLVAQGKRVEAELGGPQDIEWVWAGDRLHIVQARPITTLFPVPRTDDDRTHVYVSVGHQQMMTDAMKPLGLTMWQRIAARPMFEAGARLFVDVTAALESPAGQAGLMAMLGRSDPLIGDAIQTVLDRGDIVAVEADPGAAEGPPAGPPGGPPEPVPTDPAIVAELVRIGERSVQALRERMTGVAGPAVFDVISNDIGDLKSLLFDPPVVQAIMAGTEATWWLNDHLQEWLGETNAADTLSRSVAGNVTSEMGLALLDVADVTRQHPDVVAYLRSVEDDDDYIDRLRELPGGVEVGEALGGFLERYGMRCVGEIDITRPRWSERPSALVPAILGNVDNFDPGEARRHFDRGLAEARAKEAEVLERLRALPGGDDKADETERMVARLRTFIGYREHPKYVIVSRLAIYKEALLAEIHRLVDSGALDAPADAFMLTFDELRDAVASGVADRDLLARRMQDHRWHRTLTPPRVMTSDGEVFNGAYRRDSVPDGALVGLAVSAGTVEGRARVIESMADARVEPGDILVTTHTDPSWSPLFVAVAGLVTEVGGQMTHGAVIAREYGLPAVVGVPGATDLIRDGQRIRVHGADGYVELLE